MDIVDAQDSEAQVLIGAKNWCEEMHTAEGKHSAGAQWIRCVRAGLSVGHKHDTSMISWHKDCDTNSLIGCIVCISVSKLLHLAMFCRVAIFKEPESYIRCSCSAQYTRSVVLASANIMAQLDAETTKHVLSYTNWGHSISVRACSKLHRLLFAIKAFEMVCEFNIKQVLLFPIFVKQDEIEYYIDIPQSELHYIQNIHKKQLHIWKNNTKHIHKLIRNTVSGQLTAVQVPPVPNESLSELLITFAYVCSGEFLTDRWGLESFAEISCSSRKQTKNKKGMWLCRSKHKVL